MWVNGFIGTMLDVFRERKIGRDIDNIERKRKKERERQTESNMYDYYDTN